MIEWKAADCLQDSTKASTKDGQVVYDISYTYDQLSNRRTRIDAIAQQRVDYPYDTDYENPLDLDHPTRHNRLLQYVVRAGVDPNSPVVRTVKYTYWLTGNASNITIKDEYIDAETTPGDPNDYDWYHDLALYYFTNGQLWRAQWGKWKNFPQSSRPDPSTYQPLGVREFRYDDPRGRYLAADYAGGLMDPNHPGGTLDLQWPLNWTDYLGATPLGDAQVDYDSGPPATWPVTATTDYLLALYGQQDTATGDTTFYHEDLLGSTSLLTHRAGQGGQAAAPATTAYTAFGEVVILSSSPDPNDPNAVIWSAAIGGDLPAGFPRYGYAGQYGYESGFLSVNGPNTDLAPITLQHLGWRWYGPSLGTFIQRDPLGILAGLNFYYYARVSPNNETDPAGLDVIVTGGILHQGIAIEDPSRNGSWWVCDYMPDDLWQWWDEGDVNIAKHWAPPDGRRIRTSSHEDWLGLAKAREWDTHPPYYCFPVRCCYDMVDEIIETEVGDFDHGIDFPGSSWWW